MYIANIWIQSNDLAKYMALIILIDNVTKAIDSGCYFVGLFIDLSNAFDTVHHTFAEAKTLWSAW